MKRREMLANLGVAGLGLSSIEVFGKNQTGKKLGVAIVGLGSYGKRVADAIQEGEYCQITALVSGSESKAKEWAAKYNVPTDSIYNYQNFDAIANNPKVDLVYVILPNSMHKEFVVRSAKAKKNVITEKPMANTAADAKAMIAACKEHGVQLGVGYRLHFEPHFMEMVRMGREKQFGQVKFIEASFGFTAGDPKQWRLNKKMAGGGPLMDVGIYCIQGIRWVLGEEPSSLTAQFGPITDPSKFKDGLEESVSFQMMFPSGAVSNTFTSYKTNIERQTNFAEKGSFGLSPAYAYGPLKSNVEKVPISFKHRTHQTLQMDGIAKALLETGIMPDHFNGEEGLRDMKIIDAIYASAAKSGKKIKLG